MTPASQVVLGGGSFAVEGAVVDAGRELASGGSIGSVLAAGFNPQRLTQSFAVGSAFGLVEARRPASADAPRSAPGGGSTRVYRVEGPGNSRLDIGPGGDVSVKGDNTLFLNFGDSQRAQSFLDRRLAQGYDGTEIKSFDVPTSYVDELRASAVPESMARQFPENPLVVDVGQAADQFGLRACHLPGLRSVIVPGSGRSGC